MLLDTPVCDFGWKAPDFTLKDAHGESFTMSQHLGEKGLLIVFICNHCPYVKAIAQRLAEDARLLMQEGIPVLAIMSNDYELYEADSPENMKTFADQYGFPFPYLVDEGQEVGKQYNAVCTPDFFGFNGKGELQYRGRLDSLRLDSARMDRARMDSARMEDASNRVPELVNAMRLIAKTGQGPAEQSPSMGCSIKWR